jgi:hypothetical protein
MLLLLCVIDAASIKAAGIAYSRKFDNLDEVGHLSVLYRPEFAELMQAAINRNSPLTRAEVETVFGPLSWEW